MPFLRLKTLSRLTGRLATFRASSVVKSHPVAAETASARVLTAALVQKVQVPSESSKGRPGLALATNVETSMGERGSLIGEAPYSLRWVWGVSQPGSGVLVLETQV